MQLVYYISSEYDGDRAGLLVSGSPHTARPTLAKLLRAEGHWDLTEDELIVETQIVGVADCIQAAERSRTGESWQ